MVKLFRIRMLLWLTSVIKEWRWYRIGALLWLVNMIGLALIWGKEWLALSLLIKYGSAIIMIAVFAWLSYRDHTQGPIQ